MENQKAKINYPNYIRQTTEEIEINKKGTLKTFKRVGFNLK